MSIHYHSKIAYEDAKERNKIIRKTIRHVLFSCSEALTAEEILPRVQAHLKDPHITINSIALRITEMLSEKDLDKAPRLKVVGFKHYKVHNGRKVRRRTLRPMTESERAQWRIKQRKKKEEEELPQMQLFSLID